MWPTNLALTQGQQGRNSPEKSSSAAYEEGIAGYKMLTFDTMEVAQFFRMSQREIFLVEIWSPSLVLSIGLPGRLAL